MSPFFAKIFSKQIKMNIILVYIITFAAALNIVRDFANGCESQKCVDASKALSKKCEKEQENVLGCICKVNDDDYWKKLSDCIQSCDTLQDVIDTSPSGLKQLYCDAALAYASLSTLFPTNSFALSDVQVTGKGSSVIGNVLSTLSQLSLSQKSVTGDNMSESKGATRTSSIGNNTSEASSAGGDTAKTDSTGESTTKTKESAMDTSTSSETASSSKSTSNVAATMGCGSLISLLILVFM